MRNAERGREEKGFREERVRRMSKSLKHRGVREGISERNEEPWLAMNTEFGEIETKWS